MPFVMLVTNGSTQISGCKMYIKDFSTCQGKTELKVIFSAEGRPIQIKFEGRLVRWVNYVKYI